MAFKKRGLRAVCMIALAGVLTFGGNEGLKTVYATEMSETQGSDAYLKTFSVSPGTMTPSFSSTTTNYTITVPSDVDKLNVTCSTADANATVTEAKGFKDLKMGNNSAVIKVKGPSGTICSYYITVVRGNVAAASNPAEGAGIKVSTGSGTTQPTTPATPTTPTTPETTPGSTTETPATPSDTAADPSQTEEPSDVTEPADETAGEEPAAEETPENTPENNPEESVETMAPVPASGERYLIGGESIYADYYVTPSFDASLLPEGFVVEPYDFNGAQVQSAYLAAGDIRLLFTESADGSNAGLRIYYADDQTVLDFVPFLGYNGYVFPVRYQAQIPVPLNYTGSYMPFEKKVVSCYIYTELTGNPLSVQEGMESKDTLQPGESAADADPVAVDTLDELPEFYLFYGMNQDGQENFYLYDWNEGTYQRYVERDTSYDLDQSYFKYKDMAHQRFVFMCILFVLLLLAVFVIVNLYLKNKELKRDLDDYGDDYDHDDDDNDDSDDEKEDDDENDFGDLIGFVPAKKNASRVDEEDLSMSEPDDSEENEDDFFNQGTFEDEGYEEAEEDVEAASPDDISETIENTGDIDLMPAVEISLSQKETSAQEDTSDEPVYAADESQTGNIRKPEFKMINLSREPEPSGIDDDFEFEYIHFEDD